MEVFLKSLSGLSMSRLVSNVRVLFIPRTLVVLGAVSLPAAEAHPAKVVFAVIALHVVAASVLLDTNVTFRALKQQKTLEPWLHW